MNITNPRLLFRIMKMYHAQLVPARMAMNPKTQVSPESANVARFMRIYETGLTFLTSAWFRKALKR